MNFQEFSQAFHQLKTIDPNECIFSGVEKKWDDLPNPSTETFFEKDEKIQELLSIVDNFDRESLDKEQNLDLDLAKLDLEFSLLENTYTFNEKTWWQQCPTAGDDILNGLFLLFINDPRSPEQRLQNIFSRVQKIPWYLERQIGRLETPVKRWLDIDLQKVAGLPGFLDNLFDWAKQENFTSLNDFDQAIAKAKEAIESYQNELKDFETTENIFIGEELAQDLINKRGIDLSLQELHELSASFLRKNEEEIFRLKTKLINKYNLDKETSTEALQEFLNKKFKVKLEDENDVSGVLKFYHLEREKILKFIKEKELFPVFDEQDMIILQTPDFMAPSIPAGAMMAPQAFRPGKKTSLVYLTLSKELLDEHTELSIPAMMIHEGIPGHHLQLATAATHPSLIRKHISANDHAEGWTTMLEDYMLDVGYLDELGLVDECRFIGKRDLARMGARVAIDLYFMTGDKKYLDVGPELEFNSDDPFENAGKLLKEVSGFTDSRVQGELNWYSQERGYPLSYLTGNFLVWQLKNDFINANKGRDPLELDKIFHKIYLESGNMPVRFLRRVFEERNLL